MLATFLVISFGMMLINFYINRRIINIFSAFAIPYMIIIPINNLFMVKYGFYKISEKVIGMLLVAFICIFAGGLLAEINLRVSKTQMIIDYEQSDQKFDFYKIKKMKNYVLIVEVITLLRFLYICFSKGFAYLTTEEYSGALLHGVLGHVFLTTYPLIPILFYYWLKNKRQVIYLLATLLGIVLLFLTFVKYHSIGIILLIYLFVSLEDHKYIKKGAVILGAAAIVLFVLNYFITFFIRGTITSLKSNYYLEHLWNYIAGSLIYDNHIFMEGVRNGVSIFYKIGTFSLAPVNIFLNYFLNIKLCPHNKLSFHYVGSNGEKGNVVDAIGYLYPSKGDMSDIVLWGMFLIAIGFLFTKLYIRGIKTKGKFSITLCSFITFYMVLSFFGTFYISFTPWEILMWSVIMLQVFDKRKPVYKIYI